MNTVDAPSLTCQRGEFELPDNQVYLNCAYMGPLLKSVEEAGKSALLMQRSPSELRPVEYFDAPNRVRKLFNQLIDGLGEHHVAIMPSVSYGMAVAARNSNVSSNQNVVVVGEEFPSGVLEWRKLCSSVGAEFRVVTSDASIDNRGERWNAKIIESIDSATAVVVVPNVHWADGTLFDLKEISSKAREVGAALCVDATQSLGALPLDWKEIRPDLLIAAGYKWLLGGYGLAVAHMSDRFKDGIPLEQVWTSQVGSENFARLSEYTDSYVDDMSRFDGGQRASFTLTAMLTESISRLMEWQPDRVQEYCSNLFSDCADELATMGLYTNEKEYQAKHLFGIRSKSGWNASHIATALNAEGISVSCRGDAIRVSPNVYNTTDDMRKLMSGLKNVCSL